MKNVYWLLPALKFQPFGVSLQKNSVIFLTKNVFLFALVDGLFQNWQNTKLGAKSEKKIVFGFRLNTLALLFYIGLIM